MEGAIDLTILFAILSSRASDLIIFSSSSVSLKAANKSSFLLMWLASRTVEKTGKPFLEFSEASKLLR